MTTLQKEKIIKEAQNKARFEFDSLPEKTKLYLIGFGQSNKIMKYLQKEKTQ